MAERVGHQRELPHVCVPTGSTSCASAATALRTAASMSSTTKSGWTGVQWRS